MSFSHSLRKLYVISAWKWMGLVNDDTHWNAIAFDHWKGMQNNNWVIALFVINTTPATEHYEYKDFLLFLFLHFSTKDLTHIKGERTLTTKIFSINKSKKEKKISSYINRILFQIDFKTLLVTHMILYLY